MAIYQNLSAMCYTIWAFVQRRRWILPEVEPFAAFAHFIIIVLRDRIAGN